MDRGSSNLAAAADSLGQRQKHSINAFIARNEWIQEKSQLLENSILPDISQLDGTESQVLDDLWKQHDQIETEVDALDQGELRSLRLLAKAATQKQLSSEDTDLIEVTFRTLESLDKLLRLLRTRSKALQLLRMRIRWNRQRKDVESEYQAITTDGLSRFLKRARWTVPEASKDSQRLSDASASSSTQSLSGLLNGSSSSKRKGTAMTRQMKGETLSLDLASMNSRLYTLQYSTLPESGRILDAMIDAATIPEAFIDSQEMLESQVKEGLKGLSEFCGSLAKQWREADEIWWICNAETARLDDLKRDAEEANLKVPSEELASSFRKRLNQSQEALLRLSSSALPRLPMPLHPLQVANQNEHTTILRHCLESRHQECLEKQNEVEEAVQTYSEAVEAVIAGNTYKSTVLKHLESMRNLRSTLKITTIDASIFDQSNGTLAAGTDSELQDGEGMVSIAERELLPQAASIVSRLQKAGIDPNIRQSVQECLFALASETAHLKKLMQGERRRREYVASSLRIYEALRQQQEEAETALLELGHAIPLALWQEHQPQEYLPVAAEADKGQKKRLERRKAVQEDLATSIYQAKGDKDLTGGEVAWEMLSRQLATTMKHDHQVAETCKLLGLVESQTAAVNEHVDEGQALLLGLSSLLARISGASEIASLDGLREQYNELKTRLDDYQRAAVDDIPFVSSPHNESSPKFSQTDERIRTYLNSLCVKLSSLSDECNFSLQLLSVALTAQRELSDMRRAYDDLHCADSTADTDTSAGAISRAELVARIEELEGLQTRLFQTQAALINAADHCNQETLKDRKTQVSAALESFAETVEINRHAVESKIAELARLERHSASEESASSGASDALSHSAYMAGSSSEEQDEKCDTPATQADSKAADKEDVLSKVSPLSKTSDLEVNLETRNGPVPVGESETVPSVADESGTRLNDEALQATQPVKTERQLSKAASVSEQVDSQDTISSGLQEPEEDVFGPEVYTSDRSRTTTSSSGAKLSAELMLVDKADSLAVKFAIDDLQQAIAAITLPSSSSGLTRSTSLRLPSITEAEALQRQVSLVHAHFDDIQTAYALDEEALETTRASLRVCTEALMQTMHLATFSTAVNHCDEVFSNLLDIIDQTDSVAMQETLRLAEASVRQAEEASLSIPNDNRVAISMERLKRTWRDLRAHAEGDDDRASVSTSIMSRSSSVAGNLSGIPKAKRAASAHHNKSVSDHTAALTPRVRSTGSLSRIPIASPRTRTTSTASEYQSPRPTNASPGTFLAPQSRKKAGFNHTSPTASSLLRSVSSMSTVGSPNVQRSFSSASATSPSGSRRSSTRRVSSSFLAEHDMRPNAYRANPKRKLDVAVGRIVNKMNVPVNITPAETFKDESGKYWIGSPEPKLYFARILRSRTVMLRVGGGWQELGSFLSTHFDHLFASEIPNTLTPRRPHTQASSPSSDPKWISSASLKSGLKSVISPDNGSSVSSSRRASGNHGYSLSRSGDTRIPDDLTSLLVKSTSRSSPSAHTMQARSKSLSIPWRV